MKLLKLHDGDTECHGPCARHVKEWLGGDKEGMGWGYLEKLVEKIYGGMISTDPYDPQEVHLALTGSLSEMKVMWVTMENLTNPFVEYTEAHNDWTEDNTMTANAVTSTYSVPQNWYPIFAGVIYETNMVDLFPGKKAYKYRVGGTTPYNTVRRSQDFTFHTAPESTSNQKNTFALLGDQGTFMVLGFSTSAKIIKMQEELGIDLVHYAGDLCYAGLSGDLTPFNGVDEDDEFGHIWDLWGIQNEAISATRPFMTTPGNHESFYNFTAFNHRYKMPHERSSGNENYWFSYDYGNAHVVSLSTEHSTDPDSPQGMWLEADLAAAASNRANVPWIMLSMHRPMYCSDKDNNFDNDRKINIEPLAIKYDVDFVVQGHMHAYERTHPAVNGEVTVFPDHIPHRDEATGHVSLVDVYHSTGKGPVYVVQGNTGAMQFETWTQPQPEWSAVRFANGYIPPKRSPFSRDDHKHAAVGSGEEGDPELEGLILKSNYSDTFGFGVATFYNSTHMHYRNIPVTGSIGTDEFWVVKRN